MIKRGKSALALTNMVVFCTEFMKGLDRNLLG